MKKNAAFFDFDSTVVTKESFDEVIALTLRDHPEKERLVREIEDITRLGMEGKLPFTQSLMRRIQTTPLRRADFEAGGAGLVEHITPGMPDVFTWLREQPIETYIVSGGVLECILPVARVLGIPPEHCLTNEGIFSDSGLLTGMNTESLLWTDAGKAPAISHIRTRDSLDGTTVLVGDGSNDLAAYQAGAVSMFCGFGANVERTSVREKAPHWARSAAELLALLKNSIISNLSIK